MEFDEAHVAAMLAMQGYDVPADDLREIRLRLNDVMTHARSWDALAPSELEPWPTWLVPGRDDV